MIKRKKYFKKGMTFMEIMIVVAIIGVLASVVLVSMSAAKKRNENAAMIILAKDYEKAIYDFMYLSNNGDYPSVYTGPPSSLPNVLDCLGPDDNCWSGLDLGRSSDIDSGGLSSDIQDYIPDLPTRTTTSCGGLDYESPTIYQDPTAIPPIGGAIYFVLRGSGSNSCDLGVWSWNLGTECVGCYIKLQK